MRSVRTPLMRAIQKAWHHAALSAKKGIPVDEITEWEASRISRRTFIRTTSKAAAITGISGSAFLASCAHKDPPVVAIVGGGMAGLYAAYILREGGVQATIYESSSRTGGRIYTGRNLLGTGLNTELGAEFIDSTHSDILRLVDDFNLSLIDTQVKEEQALTQGMYFIQGRVYSDREILEMFAPLVSVIQADIDGISEVFNYKEHSDHDVALDTQSLADYLIKIGTPEPLFKLIDAAYTTEYGLDIAQQSALNFLVLIDTSMSDRFKYSGISDERYKVLGGNQSITENLSDFLEGQIQTDHTLTAIRKKDEGDKIELVFAKSGGGTSTIIADHVILTLPFTILRNIEISYPLPEIKRKAIDELGYGMNAKFFLGFDKKVWREQGYTGFMFSDSLVQNAWDNTQLQQGQGAGFTVFTGGEASTQMATMDDAAFGDKVLPLLNAAFPGMAATHNNRRSRFHWPTYKHAKASYTCFRPGQYTTLEGAQREPVGNLWFAGEHCSFEFQGFMNGAAESGRMAAAGILKALK